MTTPRHSNRFEYHFPNESVFVGRGGARRLSVLVTSLDDAACTVSVYFFKWKDYNYPFVIQADTPTYTPVVPAGRTRSAYGGAQEYTRQSLGIPLYPGNGTGVWQLASAAIHDNTTWTVEGYFITGSDITTTQVLWISADNPVTDYLFARIQAGQLNILNSAGVIISGPTTIQANTAYYMVMMATAGTPTIYLNNVTQTATGGPLTAVPLGTGYSITVGSNVGGTNPFLGSIGGFSIWRNIALTAAQISRHNVAIASAWISGLITQQTLAAGAATAISLGEGEAFPLASTTLIIVSGHAEIMTELGE